MCVFTEREKEKDRDRERERFILKNLLTVKAGMFELCRLGRLVADQADVTV